MQMKQRYRHYSMRVRRDIAIELLKLENAEINKENISNIQRQEKVSNRLFGYDVDTGSVTVCEN